MTEASKKYHKDFGYMFTVQERFTAAADMEGEMWEEYLG